MTDKQTPPLPTLKGADSPGFRRWKEMLASGVAIPTAPPGERAVSFAMDPRDVQALQMHIVLKIKWFIPLMLFAIVSSTWLNLHNSQSQTPQHIIRNSHSNTNIALSIAVSLILPLTVLIIFFAWFPKIIRKTIENQQASLLRPCTVSIMPGYLRVVNPTDESIVQWPGIKFLDQNTKYIFLVFLNNTGIAIPKWAFGTTSDVETFYNEAKQYHEQAKGKV